MKRWVSLAPLFLMSCRFLILDFDDPEGLPCPCDPAHVCLVGSNTCVSRRSVELFKSCDVGAETPDDLCEEGAICQSVNGTGKRCLLTCSPSTYGTPESGINVAKQCPPGTTCWATERGGVCSEGICNDIPNDCPPPQQCVRVNGAGVCFTPCQIFQRSPLPCAGTQLCHPITDSAITACIDSGTARRNDLCSDTDMCAKIDEFDRPMVCDRPAGSEDQRRCRAICQCPPGAPCDNSRCNTLAACAVSRANVDPVTQAGLGLCIE